MHAQGEINCMEIFNIYKNQLELHSYGLTKNIGLIGFYVPLNRGGVGWCGGPGLTSSAGAYYNLDDSRARAYCACFRCGWVFF